MYGSLVMGALRGIKKTGADTAGVLSLLNETLMQRPLEGRFCSTLYALFNPATRELTFSNAGLPLPLLVSQTTCRLLGEGGLPSGLFPVATYGQYTVPLFRETAFCSRLTDFMNRATRKAPSFAASEWPRPGSNADAKPRANRWTIFSTVSMPFPRAVAKTMTLRPSS